MKKKNDKLTHGYGFTPWRLGCDCEECSKSLEQSLIKNKLIPFFNLKPKSSV